MVLGFIAGRWLDVNLHSIARLNIFIILPFVSFGAMMRIEFNASYLLLPIVLYALSTLISLGSYHLVKKFKTDGTANLVGAGGVNGNALYFGLPVILALFGPQGAGIYLFMNLGPQINNITLAYYLVARGQFSIRQSLVRLAKFPVIYALVAGLVANACGFELNDVALKYWEYSSGSIVFLGMMMIGIGAAKIKKLSFDWALISLLFAVKFVPWPIGVLAFIWLDNHLLHQFDSVIHQILIVFSVMPLIGNLVAYASEHNLYPEKAAMAVILSSIATVVIIPVTYWLMSQFGV